MRVQPHQTFGGIRWYTLVALFYFYFFYHALSHTSWQVGDGFDTTRHATGIIYEAYDTAVVAPPRFKGLWPLSPGGAPDTRSRLATISARGLEKAIRRLLFKSSYMRYKVGFD